MKNFITLSSGRRHEFDKEFVPDIEEIASSLSKICRFTGHCNEFYSVAEHSVRASYIVPMSCRFAALMHDAHEWYVGDVTSSLKREMRTMLLNDMGGKSAYQIIEEHHAAIVAKHFDFFYPLEPAVRKADLIMLVTELRDLMDHVMHIEGIFPLSEIIKPWPHEEAKVSFLTRFGELNEVKK